MTSQFETLIAVAFVVTMGLGCTPMKAIDQLEQPNGSLGASPTPTPPPGSPPVSGVTSVPTRGTGGAIGNTTGSCSGRTYALHVPPSYNPSVPMPIVVAMYGAGDDYMNFNNVSAAVGWHSLSDSRGFIYMVPASTNPSRASFLYFNADGSADFVSIKNEMNTLLECVYRGVGSRYNIETMKINWIGFSEGASFTAVAASVLSNRLQAVAVYGGSAPRMAAEVKRQIPIYYLAGTGDFNYTAIVAQSDTWNSHPINRSWVNTGHSFIGINQLVAPAVAYSWLTSQSTTPVVSGF